MFNFLILFFQIKNIIIYYESTIVILVKTMKYRTNINEESSNCHINSNENGRNESTTLIRTIESVSKSFTKPKEEKTSISCIPSMGHFTVRPIGSPTHLEICERNIVNCQYR